MANNANHNDNRKVAWRFLVSPIIDPGKGRDKIISILLEIISELCIGQELILDLEVAGRKRYLDNYTKTLGQPLHIRSYTSPDTLWKRILSLFGIKKTIENYSVAFGVRDPKSLSAPFSKDIEIWIANFLIYPTIGDNLKDIGDPHLNSESIESIVSKSGWVLSQRTLYHCWLLACDNEEKIEQLSEKVKNAFQRHSYELKVLREYLKIKPF